MVMFDSFISIPDTGTVITVTTHSAVFVPSFVVAVIVAVPAETAVTTPSVSTVATDSLLLFHTTFWLVALAGVMVAISVSVSRTASSNVLLFNVIPVIGTITVTIAVVVLPPSIVLTVMVAVPTDTALTTPCALTVATAVLLLSHVTFQLVAFSGNTAAMRRSVSPTVSVNVLLFNLTPVTDTSFSEHAASPSIRTMLNSKIFLIVSFVLKI